MSKKRVSEGDFLAFVLDVAARYRWRAWHVPMPVRPIGEGRFVPEPRAKGLPDLVLVHERHPRLIFAELKAAGKKPDEAQAEFLRLAGAIADPRVGAYLWEQGRDEDELTAILSGKRPLGPPHSIFEIANELIANVTSGEFGKAFKSVRVTDSTDDEEAPNWIVVVARGEHAEIINRHYLEEVTDAV